MARIPVRLVEEQADVLRGIAAEKGISLAEEIRRSVEAMIRSRHGISLAERRRRAPALAGRFSGPPNWAARHDNYFAEAGEDPDDEDAP